MDDESQTGQGSESPASEARSVRPGLRFVAVGLVVVGIWALASLDSLSSATAEIALLVTLLGGVVLLISRSRSRESTAGTLLIVAAALVVMGGLDLLAPLTDLDDVDSYGGGVGLVGLVFYFVGGLLILRGALTMWGSVRAPGTGEQGGLAQRLVVIGWIVVVVAWVFMILAPGWVLVADQGLGVAAATSAGMLVVLHRRGASPLPVRWSRIALMIATALAVLMALYSLTYVIPDLGFILEFGGPQMYVPYLIYLIGGGLLGVAATRLAVGMRSASGKTGAVAAVIVVLLGLALFSLGREDPTTVPTTAAETPTLTLGAPAAVEAMGSDIAPIDACFLLTRLEAFEGLRVGYRDQASYEESGFGPLRDAGRGEMVTESCKWIYYPDPEAWENYVEDYIVLLSPGDPADFEPDAVSPWEPAEGASVEVVGVGDAAVWFPGTDAGLLSVIQETPWGLAFLRTGVGQPDLDDESRLETAKDLASRSLERLIWGPYAPVETNLCDLITGAEAEEVLARYRQGRLADAELFGPDSVTVDLTRFSTGGSDWCQKLLDVDIFVAVGQGLLTGFNPGATLEGVTGEPVTGVADQTMWFPGEIGVLNVRSGDLAYRIEVALPETPPDERLAIARDLALKARARLLGSVPVVAFEQEPPDLANLSFVDNLLAKEEAGEWTLGEGLVATLRLLLGELEPTDVLRHPELIDNSGTGILAMASEYLASGADEQAKSNISELLDILVYTNEELEEMAGIGPPTASLIELATAPPDEIGGCSTFFGPPYSPLPPAIGPCLEYQSATFDGKHYRVFYPADSMPSAGWTKDHYRGALEAMIDTILVYDEYGTTPAVNLVFSVLPAGNAGAQATPIAGKPCAVAVYPTIQVETMGNFKQVIAHELSHCFQTETYTEQNKVAYQNRKWREEGLADYMSNLVYSSNNREWADYPALEQYELFTTLFQRVYDNSIFFQFLEGEIGAAGILGSSLNLSEPQGSLIHSLPTSGGTVEQRNALAGFPNMPGMYHRFAQAMTDATVQDTSTALVPYSPDSDAHPITGPVVIGSPTRLFGVNRLWLIVPGTQTACLEYEQTSELRASWREGQPGREGAGPSWSSDLPDTLKGEAVFVATATTAGQPIQSQQLTVKVRKVVDDPDDCEKEEPPPPPPAPDCPLSELCPTGSNFWHLPEEVPQHIRDLFEHILGG